MSEILDGNELATNTQAHSGVVADGPETLVIDSNTEKFGHPGASLVNN
jgi:hypothetical protein